jgi:hypothetical protein
MKTRFPAQPSNSEWLTRKKLIDSTLKAAGWKVVPFVAEKPLAVQDHIRLHGNVENPQKTGPEKPPGQKLDEEREFCEIRYVVRAKEPRHRQRSKNKSRQTNGSRRPA